MYATLLTHHIRIVEIAWTCYRAEVALVITVERDDAGDTVPRVLNVTVVAPNVTALGYSGVVRLNTRNQMNEREREMFYLTTHSTHFIYGYMASDIWLRTILIVRKETRCRHIGYSYRLTARVLLYAPSHRQDNTYHGLCYTSRGVSWSKFRDFGIYYIFFLSCLFFIIIQMKWY